MRTVVRSLAVRSLGRKGSKFASLALAASMALGSVCPVLSAGPWATWKIPDPQTTEHPVASDAPSSSPKTYPDSAAFDRRAKSIVDAVATSDLGVWRRGYFSGGDPGKYLPNAAMAKLLLNPNDPDVAKYMNDDRTPKEHYHFAAINWARFYPLFGEKVLTDATKQAVAANAAKFGGYLSPSGTENHRTMNMMAANVLPKYLPGDRFGSATDADAARRAKEMLRTYVKGLYHGGAGEWDSSTYYMFSIHGLLNIYDFSQDPECRLLAKAGLDWMVMTYAVKYTDGIFTSPNQRGFPASHAETISDQTGWLWWGSPVKDVPADQLKKMIYTLHPITSGYRPNVVLTNLAQKTSIPLPAEFRNGHADYWYGQGRPEPEPMSYLESVYVGRHFTMGSLWNGSGGQITRFMLVARDEKGEPTVFTGGTPTHFDHEMKRTGRLSYKDGTGNYDRSAQVGPVWINLARIPDGEEWKTMFFSLPEGVEAKPAGKWMVMQAGDAYVGVYGLGGELKVGQTDLTAQQVEENDKAKAAGKPEKNTRERILRVDGQKIGLIVQAADKSEYPTLDAFAAALNAKPRVNDTTFDQAVSFGYTALDGRSITGRFDEAAKIIDANIDGRPVRREDFKIYSGPFVDAEPGKVTVNDGKQGYTVEFTGDLPVYREWKK